MDAPSNYMPNVRRRQWTPLYDTIVLAKDGTLGPLTEFFGRTAAANTIQITNMQRANELPGVEAFEVHALRVFVQGLAADVMAMYKNLVVRLYRGRVVELEAPVEFFPGGAGIFEVLATDTAVYNGPADPRAVNVLNDPIRIEGGDNFRVTLEGTTTTATGALLTRIYLDGAYDKGVQ
jgi:hypothetical protein